MSELIKKLSAVELEEQKAKIATLAQAVVAAKKALEVECLKISEHSGALFYDIDNNYLKHADWNDAGDNLRKALDKHCWKYFIDCSGIRDTMTEYRRKELEKEVEEKAPSYTAETAEHLSMNMRERYVENMAETVREVFANLSGASYHTGSSGRKRVQNNISKIDACFRISGNVHRCYYSSGHWDVGDYSRGFRYNDLEAACFMLDGKRRPRYPDTIEDRIKKTEYKSGAVAENEYFSVALYFNGNQKVSYKRLDVLEKLNKYGSMGDRLGQSDKKIFS